DEFGLKDQKGDAVLLLRAAGREVPAPQEPAAPLPMPTRRQDAAPASTGDAGSSGTGSVSTGFHAANLAEVVELPQPLRSGLIFLAGCDERPQAFSSRLFRPPRD
ncbi:MAG: hypothetical protein K2W96_00080, partial [Gemmataceae bacterium]|nr:hypothetical protein [Gemmataceae bacterium]